MSYNLDDTFTFCESMWIWLARQIEEGSEDTVPELKRQWLRMHGFKPIRDSCFFCDYAYNANANSRDPYVNMCDNYCPGKMMDSHFYCTHLDYAYDEKPIAFKNKILELSKL